MQLRTAQLSDLPGIARVWHAAFFDDEIIGNLMHPHRQEHPEDVYWFLLRGLRERFWDWRHQFVVVTVQEDGQERIAGAADWRRLGEGGQRRELATADPRKSHCTSSLHLQEHFDYFKAQHLDLSDPNINAYQLSITPHQATSSIRHSKCTIPFLCASFQTAQPILRILHGSRPP